MRLFDYNVLVRKENPTQSEIKEQSKQIFEMLKINETTLELLRELLYMEAFSSKKDTMRVVRALDDLKMRQEMLELLQSDDINKAIQDLKTTAERFAKKTKHPIGNLDALRT